MGGKGEGKLAVVVHMVSRWGCHLDAWQQAALAGSSGKSLTMKDELGVDQVKRHVKRTVGGHVISGKGTGLRDREVVRQTWHT